MKKFESSEVSSGNATGKAGISSLPFDRGFYSSKNNNDFGIDFTPNEEPTFKNYKNMKHSKKNIKNKMKKFKEFIKEEACATAGNTGGMGNVVSAQPSSTPGDVAGGVKGSGDIGKSLGTYTKLQPKKKRKKNIKIESFKQFFENDDVDNYTARYYDNYDDGEENFENNLTDDKKTQLFEEKDLIEHYTFECSGSPKPYFNTKADFFEFMEENGFKHSTLNKKTDMLIVESLDFGSLKCQKAERYGVPIYTYRTAKVKVKEMANNFAMYNF